MTLPLALLIAGPPALGAGAYTVLHTNDWQSALLGFGPNADYSPEHTGDDATVGGVARLATRIAQLREASPEPVLLVDAGDVTMGSLFHTVSRETGGELQLMAMLGYDAITLGNHDLDLRPAGLARMIRAAQAGAGCPPIVASNLVLDPQDPRDDGLEALLAEGAIRRSIVIERGGLRVGVIGVMGEAAYEVIGQADPVRIADPVAVIRELVTELREVERVDSVILLSHSGVSLDGGGWGGPEVQYLEQIQGLDAVIGGHSHTALRDPILVGSRPVVQAGSEGRFLGELGLRLVTGVGPRVTRYTLHPIDDSIPGDEAVSTFVGALSQVVTERVLEPMGLRFEQPLLHTDRDLTRAPRDSTLGNLVTDAYRVAARADLAITGSGTLRADLLVGSSGVQRVSDLFRVVNLGVGTYDDEPGYALARLYVTAAELKSIFEILLIAHETKGPSYYPRISGAQVVYNNLRVPLDRVVTISIGDDRRGYTPIDLSSERLYGLAATSYVASFLPTISELSGGLLEVQPKDAEGRPVEDVSALIVDGDPAPGMQELKAWRAWLDYAAALPDTDGDGLADLPSGGVDAPRLIRDDSLSPVSLLKNATWKMASAVGVPLALLLAITSASVYRRARDRRAVRAAAEARYRG